MCLCSSVILLGRNSEASPVDTEKGVHLARAFLCKPDERKPLLLDMNFMGSVLSDIYYSVGQ